jgi:homocysteine S-methyltransferase
MQPLHPRPPQLDGRLFLTDSGMETSLVFHEGRDLPAFAAFPLLESEGDRAWLLAWFERHMRLAERHGTGFVLDTPTWRANTDWGATLGYDQAALRRINVEAVAFCQDLRDTWKERIDPIVISGCIGPRGDGYRAGRATSNEAGAYHRPQIEAFAEAGADQVCAFTMTTIEEATGIVRAAASVGIPVAISFTVETDGRLASGVGLGAAIETVDDVTGGAAAYFMINCAHPTHFAHVLDGPWVERIAALRANASTMSHAELDEAETLDDGDPDDLGRRYADLRKLLPRLAVLGGCCGTDDRHVAAIAGACCSHRSARAEHQGV